MAFGTNYICVPYKAEQLSNQIFTYHRFSPFSPFLIMEGTNTKEWWNCVKSNEDWKKTQVPVPVSVSSSPLDDQTGNHFRSQCIPLKFLG